MKKHVRSLDLMAVLGLVSAFGCGPQGAQEQHGVEPVEAETLVERPNKPKYDASRAGPSALYIMPPEEEPCDIYNPCDGGGSGGGSGGGTTTTAPTFLSSMNRGGYGAIRDLKITKGDYSNQPTLPGYHRIDVDLNKGAGGTYIYLTFTRDAAYVVGPTNYCGPVDGSYVTAIVADDYSSITALDAKNSCYGMAAPPIWEPTSTGGWKHPELNDGSGGRYIYAWQYKDSGSAPVQEVGVIAGNSSTIQCPAGWTRVNQDLNEGAGGDYIYFCFRW